MSPDKVVAGSTVNSSANAVYVKPLAVTSIPKSLVAVRLYVYDVALGAPNPVGCTISYTLEYVFTVTSGSLLAPALKYPSKVAPCVRLPPVGDCIVPIVYEELLLDGLSSTPSTSTVIMCVLELNNCAAIANVNEAFAPAPTEVVITSFTSAPPFTEYLIGMPDIAPNPLFFTVTITFSVYGAHSVNVPTISTLTTSTSTKYSTAPKSGVLALLVYP